MTEPKCKTDNRGVKHWLNEREEYHRLDGPAFIHPNGFQQWCVNGKYHRLGGPAVVDQRGTKEWWIDGKRHRLDGPACMWFRRPHEWWVDDVWLTQQQFEQHPLVIFYRLARVQ